MILNVSQHLLLYFAILQNKAHRQRKKKRRDLPLRFTSLYNKVELSPSSSHHRRQE